MKSILTAIAYAISKGFWEAYFDAIRQERTLNVEGVTDEDRETINKARDIMRKHTSPFGVPTFRPKRDSTEPTTRFEPAYDSLDSRPERIHG